MQIEVGGKGYEIDGIAFGTMPAWKLIKSGGVPITSGEWEALPEAHKQTLFLAVQKHIDALNG